MPHAVISIAGSDPSGGAGIQADVKTISALGGYAMAAITSLTAQNTQGVRSVHVPRASFLRKQLDALSEDVRIDAVKIGMLARRDVVHEVADWLERTRPPYVVLDPVMVSRSGDRLLDPDAVAAVRDRLCRVVDVVTPNLPELGDLLGEVEATDWTTAIAQAVQLARATGARVVVKGGHLEGGDCPDALVEADGAVHELPGERIDTCHTHGTGCALSSAIATLRPARESWFEATRDAKAWLAGAILQADGLGIGQGNGPVHHFHASAPLGLPRPRTAGDQSFTAQMWADTAQVRAAIDALPFVRGLAEGTLPTGVFQEYLRQDALYLEQYSRVLATLSVLAADQQEQRMWIESAQLCLVVERELHETWVDVPSAAARGGGSSVGSGTPVTPAASATCTAYTSYLLGLAHGGDHATLVAAVLPCFWVYADVGERLQDQTAGQPEHPYRRWIDQYGDPAFAARCRQVRDLADRLAAEGGSGTRQRMAAAFDTATRYEWMFWDSPWRAEHWPV